jgi:hypothetical protein
VKAVVSGVDLRFSYQTSLADAGLTVIKTVRPLPLLQTWNSWRSAAACGARPIKMGQTIG